MGDFCRTPSDWLRNSAPAAGLALVMYLGAFQRPAQAAIIHVATTGDNTTGLSWEHAKTTVTGGLGVAVSGDQVWVAAGTYVERITLKAGVALYGGFAGNESSDFNLSLRDLASHTTILDGSHAGSVVTAPSGATASTRIDGFTIRNGSASDGAGIYCSTSSPTISNDTITGNTASFRGAGICCLLYSSPVISNNTIAGNSGAMMGGGIYCNSSSPTISNNKISGNSANSTSGFGGGIDYESSSSPTVSSNTISGNIAAFGGGISCAFASTIRGNSITGNTARDGGGICCSAAAMIVSNTIAGNSAIGKYDGFGGGVYCTSSATIYNNTIVGNGAASGSGGGICCSSSSPAISNSIVAFNSSGLYVSSGTPTVRNNCVYNPGGTNYSGLTDPTGTNGNLSVDPQLLAVDCGEVHLTAGSPCIGAGLDSVVQAGWVDMDGEPRIQGVHVDIGADEFNGAAPAFTRKIVRVDPTGNNANDGSNWALAKLTVQAGIDAVASAGGGDVWVAGGTYNQRITMKMWTHVYGGFAGVESSRDERNWTTHATTLNGGGGGSVITVAVPGYGSSTIDGFIIRNGSASYGGGIRCDSSSPRISHNMIAANSSSSSGGGIYCISSSPAISSNLISGNTAGSGAGLYCVASAPAVVNNTITGNSGGGIYCYDYSFPVISNNIVAFNSSGVYNSTGTPTLRNNCVYNPSGTNYIGLSAGSCSIVLDPLFANKQAGDYHLASGSPCIDAGYNAAVPAGTLSDLDGHLRFLDDPATPDCQWSPGNCGTAPIVDMGTYEFIPAIPGDDNHDGDVDFDDLAVFDACVSGPAVAYAGDCAKADFDQDGDVDQNDFGIFQRCFSGAGRPANPACGG